MSSRNFPDDSFEFDYPPPMDDNNAPNQLAAHVVSQQSEKDEAAAIVARAVADKASRDADMKKVKAGDMSKDDLQAMINAKLAASKKR
jgi:hypothetical protein